MHGCIRSRSGCGCSPVHNLVIFGLKAASSLPPPLSRSLSLLGGWVIIPGVGLGWHSPPLPHGWCLTTDCTRITPLKQVVSHSDTHTHTVLIPFRINKVTSTVLNHHHLFYTVGFLWFMIPHFTFPQCMWLWLKVVFLYLKPGKTTQKSFFFFGLR